MFCGGTVINKLLYDQYISIYKYCLVYKFTYDENTYNENKYVAIHMCKYVL